MSTRIFCAVGACAVLAGCGGGDPAATQSGTAPVVGSFVTADLFDENNASLSDTAGTIAYVTGLDDINGRAVALAGIGSTNVGPAGSGSATFNGDYAFGFIDSVVRTDTEISGVTGSSDGTVTLFVNFATGGVSGTGSSSSGISSNISVDGTISGQTMSGAVDVSYVDGSFSNSLSTTLDGVVGADGAVGVFHGNNADTTIAGGFVTQ